MKSLFLAAIFALTPVAAVAQDAPIRVFLDTERAIQEAGLNEMSAADEGMLKSVEAAVRAAETRGKALQADFANRQLTMTERQQRDMQDQMTLAGRDYDDATRTYQRTFENIRQQQRAAADKTLNASLETYRAGSRIGIIELIDSRVVPRVIIRNGTYDLTSHLAEMVKSGPGAEVPLRPQRQARTAYINFDRAVNIVGDASPASQQVEAFRKDRQKTMDAMQAEARDLQYRLQSPTLNEETRAQVSAQYSAKIDQIRSSNDLFVQQAEEARRKAIGDTVKDIAAFAKTDASAQSWDVIRIYTPGTSAGNIQIIDPTLDITDEVATAYMASLQ